MKKIYEAPALNIFAVVSDQNMASMNFGDLKDAAHDGNNGDGAVVVDPTHDSIHDVVVPTNGR